MASQIDQNIQPTVSIHGNLRRTRNGAIWAEYRLFGLPYTYTSDEMKYQTLVHHKNLFRALPNGSVLTGFIAAMDPDEIVARSIIGTDINSNPDWRAECEGKLEHFQTKVRATERLFTLAFPVVDPDNPDVPDHPTLGSRGRRSVGRERAEMAVAAEMAAAVVARLPEVLELQPLTPAQMVWLWNRAISRGSAPEIFPASVVSNVASRAGAFRQATFDEGERNANVKRWKPSSFAPLLKITQPGNVGAAESWQMLLAIEALPLDGLQFPGSEFFTIADKVNVKSRDGKSTTVYDVDWALRVSKTHRDQAIARNGKNLKRLSEQMDERDMEVSFAERTLSDQVLLLGEYNNHLESDDDEMEIALCPVFAIAGTTRAQCQQGAMKATEEFQKNRIKVVAPLGGQRELWAAMNPGGTRMRAVSDFSHVTISEFAAACIPFGTASIGDPRGPIFAENLSGGRHQPVHLEWYREAERDASPSVAFIAELGAGKTWGIHTLLDMAWNAVRAQYLTTDRTTKGEYVGPARMRPRHAIVDLMNPEWSMDPLRIFPRAIGVDKSVDLLTPIFGCEANDPMGMTLGEILHPSWNVASLPGLLDVLEQGVNTDKTPDGKPLPLGWQELYRHLNYWSGRHYAASLFNKNLQPLDLDADAIVIRTDKVDVPTEAEVAQGGPLSPSKIFGRAIYGLSAEIGARAFMANEHRFGSVVFDEAYHVLSTNFGLAAASRVIRDGRKHNTGCVLGSHSPSDFPEKTAMNLIPIRIVMRQRDEQLAAASLKWLGIDPVKEDHIVRDLMRHTSPKMSAKPGIPDEQLGVIPGREGEGYLRDARGAIGRIKILGPSSARLRSAMTTTPKSAKDTAA
ncbi:Type IV secretory pathway, VirB4 components [Mycobacteroides abscessus subsp. abscessus]|uniref:ATP-binding protein n=1 Tax=Mycobacteroides abscessus TaxID=36809 RepID=UPI000928C6FC|nr:ATP-binding protein [Mycobacteroides abscessus]SIJ21636.1 Type IV secretory pathway, VirB4 components [Mycobacteroides abscessus subsp. abscessus]SLH38898.1 Type IV secretory pathway, VirB4 components [Mycobacteroides abscessus subsp. abscessus]